MRFLKENWFYVAVFALFLALATSGPDVTRATAWYVVACLVFGFIVYRPATAAKGPRRWKRTGRILKVLAPAAGIALIAELLWASPTRFGFAMAIFAALAAWAFYYWSAQLSAPDAFEVRRRDPRPPVLFLRPFREDTRPVYDAPVGERAGDGDAAAQIGSASHEPALAAALSRIGPFIAIGQPGEPLATLGASRVYLGDDDWKPFVEETVPAAAAVVLLPETTPGTLWEVGLVARKVDLRRLLLIVPDPSLRPLRFEHVRKLVEETYGVALPPAGTSPPCEAFYFDAHRQPVPIRLKPPEAIGAFVEHVLALGPPARAV